MSKRPHLAVRLAATESSRSHAAHTRRTAKAQRDEPRAGAIDAKPGWPADEAPPAAVVADLVRVMGLRPSTRRSSSLNWPRPTPWCQWNCSRQCPVPAPGHVWRRTLRRSSDWHVSAFCRGVVTTTRGDARHPALRPSSEASASRSSCLTTMERIRLHGATARTASRRPEHRPRLPLLPRAYGNGPECVATSGRSPMDHRVPVSLETLAWVTDRALTRLTHWLISTFVESLT